MSEKEKMLSGKLYDTSDSELARLRVTAHDLCLRYNSLSESAESERGKILSALFPDSSSEIFLQGPIFIDYGVFTSFGRNCYANFNFTLLDSCPVTIGDDVFFGPNCALYTPVHPMLSEERKMRSHDDGTLYDLEYAKPIVIGSGCWFGGGVTVCGGVTIGKNCVIGAGSVVTRDIPDDSFAAGNPCRVIRGITDADSVFSKKELL